MIKAEDLSRAKLSLISIGSLGGMGLGLLLSLVFNTPTLRLIIATFLCCMAIYLVYKNLPYLVIHN